MAQIIKNIELHKAESELECLVLERAKLQKSTRDANASRAIRKLTKEIDRAEAYKRMAEDLHQYLSKLREGDTGYIQKEELEGLLQIPTTQADTLENTNETERTHKHSKTPNLNESTLIFTSQLSQ